jgi:hypothetical protein
MSLSDFNPSGSTAVNDPTPRSDMSMAPLDGNAFNAMAFWYRAPAHATDEMHDSRYPGINANDRSHHGDITGKSRL